MHKWFVYPEFEKAAQAAADFLAKQIDASIQQRNICHVILPGGNTPIRCLNLLSQKKLPWERVHWYPGDERCYPAGHAERNDVMLKINLWSLISATNIHCIPAELGAEQAASVYREHIRSIEKFDIAFLGMGEDGHTASLFPDNDALLDTRSVIPVYDSPKAPAQRVSLSLNTLKNARCRMVLTGGASKANVIERIKAGDHLPVNCVGDIHWYVDTAASGSS